MNIVERAQLKMEKISRLNMGDYLCVARLALVLSTKQHSQILKEKNWMDDSTLSNKNIDFH